MSFIANLFPFQDYHEENLIKKCADNNELVLNAPTGSGKTVLACKFIDDYLDENPETVFLWLCPGAGGLHIQSQEVFNEVVIGVEDGDVYDFITDSDPRGKVFFINWDKINKKSNKVLREGEQRDLMLQVSNCHRLGVDIFMVVDEEHKYRDTMEKFIIEMAPRHVLKISATTVTDNPSKEVIKDEEVIGAGLIAESIVINEDVAREIETNDNIDDDLLLIELADKKRIAIQKEYDKLGIDVRPLVLIQFPNGKPEWIERVKSKLDEMGYGDKSGLTACWFSGEHPDNANEIMKLNGQYSFLLFKQAIATGWDCPRAKILVKLREGGSEKFNIQTIGRIRRMPERKHYDNEILDRCYLYTLDSKFNEGLTKEISSYFYSYLHRANDNHPNLYLDKEFLTGSDRYAANPIAVVDVVRKHFMKVCDANGDGVVTRSELEKTKGFVFGTKLKTSAIEGVARTTHDITLLNSTFKGEHEINIHDDGFIIRDAKRKIAQTLKIDESISSNALRILFDKQDTMYQLGSQKEYEYESANKIIHDMSHREYNAFLVNNRDVLISIFQDISVNDVAEIEEVPTERVMWAMPHEQYYCHHKKREAHKYMKKNVFKDYGDNILIEPNRSSGEIKFEEWCEQQPNVKWIYKNGDKGSEYFSIVYRMALRRSNFYPDYFIGLENGDVWIIEVKGGASADGKSDNIDSYAANKMNALIKYVKELDKPKIKCGFVRASGLQLYISTTVWDEALLNAEVWKPIEEIVK